MTRVVHLRFLDFFLPLFVQGGASAVTILISLILLRTLIVCMYTYGQFNICFEYIFLPPICSEDLLEVVVTYIPS
jgi:hypothetical protein